MTSWSRLKEVYERWPTLILAGLVFGFLLSSGQLFPTAPAPLLAVLIGTAAVAIFDLLFFVQTFEGRERFTERGVEPTRGSAEDGPTIPVARGGRQETNASCLRPVSRPVGIGLPTQLRRRCRT